MWIVAVCGYFPAILVTGTSLFTKPSVIMPLFNETNSSLSVLEHWQAIEGLDI
jgi:hypothetical protein